jgi:hypothetical protein
MYQVKCPSGISQCCEQGVRLFRGIEVLKVKYASPPGDLLQLRNTERLAIDQDEKDCIPGQSGKDHFSGGNRNNPVGHQIKDPLPALYAFHC